MAIVQKTAAQAAAAAVFAAEQADTTTEQDIRQHMIEDGEDPDIEFTVPRSKAHRAERYKARVKKRPVKRREAA